MPTYEYEERKLTRIQIGERWYRVIEEEEFRQIETRDPFMAKLPSLEVEGVRYWIDLTKSYDFQE